MIVGVDGSNLRGGGGITHVVNLLRVADPAAHGIERIVVWGARRLLDALPTRPWLEATWEPALDGSLPRRLRWQAGDLPRKAAAVCRVLFAPGASAPHSFRPLVTMSQNLLPFDAKEMRRYGMSATHLRLRLLRVSQSRTLRRADGVIFPTEHARQVVTRQIGDCRRTAVIPHGLEARFRIPPRPPRALARLTSDDPLRVLYVSIVDVYKHQPIVAEAAAGLRSEGIPLCVDFVGPAYPPALRRLQATLQRLDPHGEFLHYRGSVDNARLHEIYSAAEVFVFASSCETISIILLEAMAAGLPIASSSRGPMPEVLGGAGELFDPERVESVAHALRRLAIDPELRRARAAAAFARSSDFSWERCAADTLDFVASTAAECGRAGSPV